MTLGGVLRCSIPEGGRSSNNAASKSNKSAMICISTPSSNTNESLRHHPLRMRLVQSLIRRTRRQQFRMGADSRQPAVFQYDYSISYL